MDEGGNFLRIHRKCCQQRLIKFPVILFVDGHTTHISYETSSLCAQLGIILIALYPNANRILQPADVSDFQPLKTHWSKFVAIVLKDAIENFKTGPVQNGFKCCGLRPWDRSEIDYTK